ncbi:hypothetical protein D9615_005639 [Tricholomella constricta]|uniref:GPR1/FUN34/yaaH family-domain-containing protein n=1 Tax=Tricholomella constricta TaxID=117010 RepID=A0A8H5HEG3_9AGAR|nr:hypothetical protein D9615_005639 [Tricholomella constricta]
MTKHDIEKSSVEAVPPQQAYGYTNGSSAPRAPRPTTIGNPGTLGLFSFASTTFILSMFNISTRSITHPNVVVGMAIFCGGLVQLLAGMWEFPRGNVFGATENLRKARDKFRGALRQTRFMDDHGCRCAKVFPSARPSIPFSSYGAFWMSYATILIPGSGILAAFDKKSELQSALGIYLVCWCMVTFFLGFASLGKHVGFILLFGFLGVTYACLAAGEFKAHAGATKAGGVLGVITAFIAYYIGLAELLASEQHPVIRLPLGLIHPKQD